MKVGVFSITPGALRCGLAGLALSGSMLAHAAGEYVLAHVAPFTGPVAFEAAEYNAGIRLALKAANAAGGVHGRQLVLRSEDDGYNPDKSVALFNQLGATETLAALMPVGSPAMTKMLKAHGPEALKLPLVGVIPGAEPLRTPLDPYVFHVRAGDLDQYRKLVDHALTTGVKRVAVAYADLPFGAAGLAAIDSMLKRHSMQAVARVAIPVDGKAKLPDVMNTLAKATPDIVFVISPAQLAGDFIKVFRAMGMTAQLGMPSYGNAETLCQVAGNDAARGTIVAQVMPNVTNTAIPIVRRFQDDLRKYGEKGMRPTIFQLEAYVTTQLTLDAMRRAGPGLNRARLTLALDSLKKYDLGGFAVDFSATKHTGSDFVDISIVGRDCRLIF